jgi:ankyrin repeat protein
MQESFSSGIAITGAVLVFAVVIGWIFLYACGSKNLVNACARHERADVERLLAAGADVNMNSDSPMKPTPLLAAVSKNHVEIARALLSRGADPNAGVSLLKPLAEAARLGNADMVRLLLEHGANPNTPGVMGSTPLIMAKSSEIARALLDRGALINVAGPDGRTPLMVAAMNGDLDLTEFLLQKGADPSLTDRGGKTALALARESEDSTPEVVRLLENRGGCV